MFDPYIIKHGFSDLDFFVATQQAADWYDPPKDYVLLEYGWVTANIDIKNKRVIDGGCHHGHYAVVLDRQHPKRLELVDIHESNLDVCEVNMLLNVSPELGRWVHGALWKETGKVNYDGRSNGALVINQQGGAGEGGIEVDAFRLKDIDPKAQVVKLDIEGAEYVVIPEALESMNVESWIIEFHAGHNIKEAPDLTAELLREAGYELDWVNREKNVVEPYKIGTEWKTHSTIFARK